MRRYLPSNHDHFHVPDGELVRPAEHLGGQVDAEGVALGVVVQRERAGLVPQLSLDERRDGIFVLEDS